MKKENDNSVIHGSGNIFADLELPNPEERGVKAKLASKIYDKIEARGWTQTQAAHELGVSQPDVSRLTRGILNDFSIDRLMLLLGKLNYRVSIHLESDNEQSDEILVTA